MHWFVDFILLAVLLTYSFRHFHYGLMHTVFSMAKFLASLVLAVIFGGYVGALLADGYVGSSITEKVYGKLVDFTGETEGLAEFFADLPGGFVRFTRLFGADMTFLQEKYGELENSEAVLKQMAETISDPLVNTVCAVIGYVLVFGGAYLALSIVAWELQKIKIPILSGVDKAMGLLLGMVFGLFNASLVASAVYCALEYYAAINSDPTIMSVYTDSCVFRYIYDLKFYDFIRNLI